MLLDFLLFRFYNMNIEREDRNMRFTKGHLRLSRKEIWNFSEEFSKCICDGLSQFKNADRESYPGTISQEEWEEYLNKMIFSFKEISTQYRNDPYTLYFNELIKDLDNLEINEIKVPDSVLEESKKYNEKIKEGLRLFSEYYTDLWD